MAWTGQDMAQACPVGRRVQPWQDGRAAQRGKRQTGFAYLLGMGLGGVIVFRMGCMGCMGLRVNSSTHAVREAVQPATHLRPQQHDRQAQHPPCTRARSLRRGAGRCACVQEKGSFGHRVLQAFAGVRCGR